ncbi:MAG TPA: hypothetical protein VKU39_10185 [Streptosporangiaceae bacterium]|nr:hypothetical protein [Streptosporangiaceae bacterium]
MYLQQAELARDRMRSHLRESRQLSSARQLAALRRVKRAERKAERRLVQAWRARQALESTLGLAE